MRRRSRNRGCLRGQAGCGCTTFDRPPFGHGRSPARGSGFYADRRPEWRGVPAWGDSLPDRHAMESRSSSAAPWRENTPSQSNLLHVSCGSPHHGPFRRDGRASLLMHDTLTPALAQLSPPPGRRLPEPAAHEIQDCFGSNQPRAELVWCEAEGMLIDVSEDAPPSRCHCMRTAPR